MASYLLNDEQPEIIKVQYDRIISPKKITRMGTIGVTELSLPTHSVRIAFFRKNHHQQKRRRPARG